MYIPGVTDIGVGSSVLLLRDTLYASSKLMTKRSWHKKPRYSTL